MAQTPDTASQSGMPTSAIATGLVDFVLPPDQMPKALLEYVRTRACHRAAARRQPSDTSSTACTRSWPCCAPGRSTTSAGTRRGRFSGASSAGWDCITSRASATYVDFLRAHPAEADQLFKDLLIGVTSFFRDPAAFEELATKVLAALVKQEDAETPDSDLGARVCDG